MLCLVGVCGAGAQARGGDHAELAGALSQDHHEAQAQVSLGDGAIVITFCKVMWPPKHHHHHSAQALTSINCHKINDFWSFLDTQTLSLITGGWKLAPGSECLSEPGLICVITDTN